MTSPAFFGEHREPPPLKRFLGGGGGDVLFSVSQLSSTTFDRLTATQLSSVGTATHSASSPSNQRPSDLAWAVRTIAVMMRSAVQPRWTLWCLPVAERSGRHRGCFVLAG